MPRFPRSYIKTSYFHVITQGINKSYIFDETEDIKELSKYMQRLNTKYAKYYNTKYNRVGYVFRDRYKSEGIYSDNHLYNCIRYIYNNPVKAGICDKESEYPYSNYKEINGNIDNQYCFIDVEENYEKIYKDAIEDFLNDNNIKLDELNIKKDKLKELIIMLKNNYNLSFRKISKEIHINREKLRKLYIE